MAEPTPVRRTPHAHARTRTWSLPRDRPRYATKPAFFVRRFAYQDRVGWLDPASHATRAWHLEEHRRREHGRAPAAISAHSALMAGDVHAMFDAVGSSLPHIQSGVAPWPSPQARCRGSILTTITASQNHSANPTKQRSGIIQRLSIETDVRRTLFKFDLSRANLELRDAAARSFPPNPILVLAREGRCHGSIRRDAGVEFQRGRPLRRPGRP